ncbi:MAG TPA: DUF4276 family protein [Sedimentisphaerales bacterium]|nr:DUF4276 family protein [Sedimentisphaerales bacterium]
MSQEDGKEVIKRPVSLLLAEGSTDEIFYKKVKISHLRDCRATVRELHGLRNINAKVIDQIVGYIQAHKDEVIRVYCCLDRESRYGEVPGFDIKKIEKYIKDGNLTSVLSIDLITATQQIESWFFYDIEGIYVYITVPKSKRSLNTFRPPEKCGYRDLQRLFERYGKTYTKGKRAESFIKKLDVDKIVCTCKELREGIQLIQSQADDLTNHLFPKKKPRKH